jgi:hypothetical protein
LNERHTPLELIIMLFVSYMTRLVSVNRSIRKAVRFTGSTTLGHGRDGSISYSGRGDGDLEGDRFAADHFCSSASQTLGRAYLYSIFTIASRSNLVDFSGGQALFLTSASSLALANCKPTDC